jgi:hypothetical protein
MISIRICGPTLTVPSSVISASFFNKRISNIQRQDSTKTSLGVGILWNQQHS